MRTRIAITLTAAAVAVGGSAFVATSSASFASGRTDRALRRAEAFVARRCPATTRGISSSLWQRGWRFNVLYGNCRAEDGRDQHAWFFDRGRFVRMDARSSSHEIIGLWRDSSTIALLYVLYRNPDPECCPTGGGAIVRYRLEHDHVRRLDPLPPPWRQGRIGR